MSDQLSADLASLRIARARRPGAPGSPCSWWLRPPWLWGRRAPSRWASRTPRPGSSSPRSRSPRCHGVARAGQRRPTATGYVVPQVVAKVGAKALGARRQGRRQEGEAVKAGQEIPPRDCRRAEERRRLRPPAARPGQGAAARARARSRAPTSTSRIQFDAEEARRLGRGDAGQRRRRSAARVTWRQRARADVRRRPRTPTRRRPRPRSARSRSRSATRPSPRPSTAPRSPSRPRVGDVVGPHVDRSSRSPTSRTLLVEIDVPEARLGLVKKGAPVRDRPRRLPRQAPPRRGRRDRPARQPRQGDAAPSR